MHYRHFKFDTLPELKQALSYLVCNFPDLDVTAYSGFEILEVITAENSKLDRKIPAILSKLGGTPTSIGLPRSSSKHMYYWEFEFGTLPELHKARKYLKQHYSNLDVNVFSSFRLLKIVSTEDSWSYKRIPKVLSKLGGRPTTTVYPPKCW